MTEYSTNLILLLNEYFRFSILLFLVCAEFNIILIPS